MGMRHSSIPNRCSELLGLVSLRVEPTSRFNLSLLVEGLGNEASFFQGAMHRWPSAANAGLELLERLSEALSDLVYVCFSDDKRGGQDEAIAGGSHNETIFN